METKGNYAARTTGNVAIEIDILEKSKAHRFLLAFPIPTGWHGQVLSRTDIHDLLNATKLEFNGRLHKFRRVQTGQYADTISALVPTAEILRHGEEVTKFIQSIKQTV